MAKQEAIHLRDLFARLKALGLFLRYEGDPLENIAFPSFTCDSRKVQKDGVFIAYPGVQHDGHSFIKEVLKKGVALVICERSDEIAAAPLVNKKRVLIVSDARGAWAIISSLSFRRPELELSILGITGTNGKTSIAFLTHKMLALKGIRSGLIGTLGVYIDDKIYPSSLTTPDPPELFKYFAEMRDVGIKYLIMEVSSHALSMHKLLGLKFKAVAFSSFSQDHLDYHQTMQAYWDAKCELFTEKYLEPGCKIFLSGSLPNFPQIPSFAKVSCYSSSTPVAMPDTFNFAQYKLTALAQTNQRKHLYIHYQNIEASSELGLFADYAAENFCAALLLVHATCGQLLEPALWQKVPQVPGRLELVKVNKNDENEEVLVFVDYAHSPDALEKCLLALRQLSPNKLWLVFGCGGDRDRGKRPKMAAVAERLADKIIVTSDNPRKESSEQIFSDIYSGFSNPKAAQLIPDRKQAIGAALLSAQTNDIVLIAGKGHENYQIIGDQIFEFSDPSTARQLLISRLATKSEM
ncbi:MAG: UDP-N-acetylmuramoyl-L-alanyl-D-glutamate--2,6-diaminopimelate ligase [Oligoflexales bacterium]|nr:UDP-N-acetylmuramoyl-L-alanyl-D-glutamate--2,6-diaminopimelate ligase [Oligoflexales bacterium]